jgi:drug/metabolite transporter (DMT)-like permease
MIISTLLIILVFALGLSAVLTQGLGSSFTGFNSDVHHTVGLGMLILILLQVLLGILARRSPSPSSQSPIRWVHMLLGGGVCLGMYWQTWEGLHVEWNEMSDSMTVVPEGLQVLFWWIVGVQVGVYAVQLGNRGMRGWEEGRVGEVEKEKLLEEA